MRVKSHIWYWFFGIISLCTIASSTKRASAQVYLFNDTEQPEISLEPQNIITCSTTSYAQSSFTIVGRDGSLPPSYLEPLTGTLLTSTQLAKLEGEIKRPREEGETKRQGEEPHKENSQIVEAQGWVKTKNGKIILVAHASEATLSSRPTISGCSIKK